MEKTDRILITGGRGMVGKHLLNHLTEAGYTDVCISNVDLMSPYYTKAAFAQIKPTYVFHMAAYVRGIAGNMKAQSYSFVRNTTINMNVIDACREVSVRKIVAMGTVAMYPDKKSEHYSESDLWEGQPHSSEYGYGNAKRHMLAQLECYKNDYGISYACAISTNLYGAHDRFDIEHGHVIPSLVRKFYEAKRDGTPVSIWGDGSATRDFLYVKDAVRGLVMMMESGEGAINLSTGDSYTIRQAAETLGIHSKHDVVEWDTSKPVGQKHRQYDMARLRALGFMPEYSLARGLKETYDWYSDNSECARK
jgi:GDP-L-fucose synthase